jgi:hypothetical protein
MSDHANRHTPRWLAGLLLLLGLIFLGVGGWFAERRLAVMNSWPTVEAEVVHSEVTSYEDSEGSTLYKAAFRFRYTVNGQEFITDTDNGYGTSFRSWMQKKVDRFAPGTRHPIHYNAANPAEIEYNAGYNFEFFGIPLFCTGMGLIIGLAGVGAMRRRSADRCPSCAQYITPGQTACPNCGLPLPSASEP